MAFVVAVAAAIVTSWATGSPLAGMIASALTLFVGALVGARIDVLAAKRRSRGRG
jgi:hypothetical protein